MKRPIPKDAPPYPKHVWPLRLRTGVGEADRFVIARQFGLEEALAPLEMCRDYVLNEGEGGLEELHGTPNDPYYEQWVARGRPARWERAVSTEAI